MPGRLQESLWDSDPRREEREGDKDRTLKRVGFCFEEILVGYEF